MVPPTHTPGRGHTTSPDVCDVCVCDVCVCDVCVCGVCGVCGRSSKASETTVEVARVRPCVSLMHWREPAICIISIGVVSVFSVYMVYNCVYYCDTLCLCTYLWVQCSDDVSLACLRDAPTQQLVHLRGFKSGFNRYFSI
jgi:hypothetical protein